MKSLKLLFSLCALAFFACTSTPNQVPLSLAEDKRAMWIEDGIALPESDSLFYLEHPAPLFRKEFNTDRAIKSASLSITAAGYFKASINGEGIKENVLDPAWTDFSKRIYYSEYDVTSMIEDGANCLGVSLGNGFYNPLPMRKWGRRNLRNDLTVGKPVFIAKLHISYENGDTEEIVTDDSWKYTLGPITKNSVYIGVAYNANREVEGWNKPGFDDTNWKAATIGTSPGGKLEKAFFPPVEITQEIIPIDVHSPEEGVWVVDMGVNFTGTYKIKLAGNVGDTISFKFGERIYEDGNVNPMTTVIGQIKRPGIGGPGAPAIAWQTDSYIVGDKKGQWFSPDFTYHTFRYMEIKGLKEKPQLEDIRGLFMHTNVINQNSFSSSSQLLNSIQDISKRTFLANLVSVQSDCAAREKFGYGGDLNATNETFIYNFDMQSFYRKTIYDWVDAMKDSTFVDTAPFTGVEYCGISWESAYLTTQYYLYLYYNDTDIIHELYELNNKWMDKVAMLHPEGLVDEGLSDHESLEPVPVQLTGTSHYLQSARIMATFAEVMGRTADVKKYEKLADQLKGQIKAEFWDKPFEGKINRQTLFATLLYHKIVPEDQIPAARDSMLVAIKNGPTQHLNTGIFGTKYALEVLAEYGSPNAVFDIVNSREYPGWGFMIDQGATTIWETWKESDNTFSNNHPMFGTVSEWYYRWLAGIRPDPEHPGFQEFYIAPTTPNGLESVKGIYNSPFGEIVSSWKKVASESYVYEISVPKGSIANVTLPIIQSQKVAISNGKGQKPSTEIEGMQTGQFALEEGSYVITVAP
ncbi:family 78 glycoside hydrolase catalytic domain [Algoriphagus aquimarinus]|uniref:family 78 glycoside hydrolase catalytic domain n=1 Tax=Algoriphagus aquimarinus TaxID=237018 RepID=UPI0030D98EB8|tara:strand:+ start:194407 stop:196824 length:2418 start_codon:yes stop_codon:yes gene_type:complete